MTSCKVLTLSDFEDWANYYDRFNNSDIDFYYHPSYYKLYENYGDGLATCFVFESDGDFAIYPFLLKEVNSSSIKGDDLYYDIQGAYGYNGVVSSSSDKNFIEKFYLSFNKFIKEKRIIAEFTRFHPRISNVNFSKDHMSTFFDRYTVGVELNKNLDELKAAYSRNTRRDINIAKRNNLSIMVLEKNFEIEIFKNIYSENMHRIKSGDYLFFNDNYFAEIFNLKNIVQFIIFKDNIAISSSVCFYSNDYFHYHLGASLGDYLSMCPNNLLLDKMIEYAHSKKFKFIHLGGGLSSDENDTLFKFKRKYSDETYNFFIGKKVHNKEVYDSVILAWEKENPTKNEIFQKFLLKYRM